MVRRYALRDDQWARGGVWERVFAALSAAADNEYDMLDGTSAPPRPSSSSTEDTRQKGLR